MAQSDRFRSQMRLVWKSRRGNDADDLLESIRGAVFPCLSRIPEEMRYDLFRYFVDTYAPNIEQEGAADALIDALGLLVSLLDEDYIDADDGLTDSDLAYIRDSVSDFALELDQDLLTYIMRIAVARHLFDR